MEISSKKEQLKKCQLFEEKFIELEPYSFYPENLISKRILILKISKFREKELKISGKSNQIYILKGLAKMVFQNNRSRMLNIKNYLSGKFL